MSRHNEGLPEPAEGPSPAGEQHGDTGHGLPLAVYRRVALARARATYPPLRRLLDCVLGDADAQED